MFVRSIELANFRNIEELSMLPSRRFNLLMGNNAQGKTNIIESISLISNGSSFRTSEFRDMLMWDETCSEAKFVVSNGDVDNELKSVIREEGKEFFKDGKKARHSSGSLATVIFAPEEILLIKDSPAARRKYVDRLISHVKPAYSSLIRKYAKIVSQRNSILQNDVMSERDMSSVLAPWDDQLITVGSHVFEERSLWCEKLGGYIPSKYSSIADGDGEARIQYIPSCGSDTVGDGREKVMRWMEAEISRRRSDEFARRISLVGPHRDDLACRVAGRDISSFGSQGQHRTFILAMKIAEVDFLKDNTGGWPVLLLDDVTSELDRRRIEFLFEYLKNVNCQTFITTTKVSDTATLAGEEVSIFTVEAGSITDSRTRRIAVCADAPS